jgi:glycosyltransferase involved in cell wall biosynthesis
MTTNVTLSIVIPAKNEEKFLPFLLDSLDKQTSRPTQIILADAYSTDRTREIAAERGCRVVDGGLPGPGRNAGAKLATGEIILFLDADVQLLDPNFIELALNEFETKGLDIATPSLELIGGTWFDKLGHRVYDFYVRLWGALRPHAPGFCIFIRRSLFEAIQGFDETILLAEDYDLALRAGKAGKFGFLNSIHIGVTDRRFRRDGSAKTAFKFILAELHLIFIGPIRHNRFNYSFGHDDESKL